MEKLSVDSLSKISKLSRKTIYKAFHGTASNKSVIKVQKSILKLTGQLVPVKEITKGRYSDNSLIKSVCKNIEVGKKYSLISASDSCVYHDCGSCESVSESDYTSSFSVCARFAHSDLLQDQYTVLL